VFGLGRRVIDLGILFLAAYAFVFVPLGKHTGLELVRGILRTHAAESATREVGDAIGRVTRRLWTSFGTDGSRSGTDAESAGANDDGSGHDRRSRRRDGTAESARHGVPVVPKMPRSTSLSVVDPAEPDAPDASL
jgi:hypothetical protein